MNPQHNKRRKLTRAERKARAKREDAKFMEGLERVADKIAAGKMIAVDNTAALDMAASNDPMDIRCIQIVVTRATAGDLDCAYCRQRLYPAGPAVVSRIVRVFDPKARRHGLVSVLCRNCDCKPEAMEQLLATAHDMFPGMVPVPAATLNDTPTTLH